MAALKSSMKILILEDIPNFRKSIKTMLIQVGFKNVSDVDTVDAAHQIMEECDADGKPVELIICNYQLSEKNGIDFYQETKSKFKRPFQFILMSGESNPDDIRTAVTSGIKNIILKPFSKEDLKSKIVQTFNSKAAA